MLLFRSGGSDPKNAVEEPKSSTPAATEIPATVPASDTFDVQKPAPEIIQPVILENPANGKTFSRNEEILFTWKQQVDSLTHFFIHSDANGRLLLWKSIKPGIREYQLPARTFLPGQYYWYVGSQTVKSTFFIVE